MNQGFYTGDPAAVNQKNKIFTTLVTIASEMDTRPDRNGCVITKIPFEQDCLFSLGFGKLITDEKGPQFPRFLKNSTEKIIRTLTDDLMSSRETRNEAKGQYAGGMNLGKIIERNFSLYSCSGYEEKYDESIVLIGGIFDSEYGFKLSMSQDYYFRRSKDLISKALEKISFESPEVIEMMFQELKTRILV